MTASNRCPPLSFNFNKMLSWRWLKWLPEGCIDVSENLSRFSILAAVYLSA